MLSRPKNHRCCGGVISRQYLPHSRAATEPKSPVVITMMPPGPRCRLNKTSVPRGSGRCSMTSSITMMSTFTSRCRVVSSTAPGNTDNPDLWQLDRGVGRELNSIIGVTVRLLTGEILFGVVACGVKGRRFGLPEPAGLTSQNIAAIQGIEKPLFRELGAGRTIAQRNSFPHAAQSPIG